MYGEIAEITFVNECVIFSDFNIPLSIWGPNLTTHSGRKLYANVLESALYHHVKQPARGENILDLIFITDESLISNESVGSEFSSSDHLVITFDILITKGNAIKN